MKSSPESNAIPQENPLESFDSFGLKATIMRGVKDAGFKIPSPIQQKVIPIILQGKDLVAQAHTGTGKTAAFGLPAMHMLHLNKGVEMLVITPTRELATQVSDELFRLGSHQGVKTATVYGGRAMSRQLEMIRRGSQVVVATPGRLLDMLSSGHLPHFRPSIVVLDEADEMLDMGFLEDIQKIFTFLPKKRQTLLFSATMPAPIQKLAKEILDTPTFVSVTAKETTNKDIKQYYYVIESHERDDAVIRLIDCYEPTKSVIFCRTRSEVDRLSEALMSRGYMARGLHGEMEQRQREDVINAFRAGRVEILVATDVAARGLNVVDISHVFNYHIPFDPESYVHRIGRTARAGRKGMAITLVTPLEYKELQRILKTVGSTIEQNYIPNRKEASKVLVMKLVETIRRQPLSDEAADVLKALEEEIDLSQISMKLISMLMTKQNVTGPDSIGIDVNRMEKIMKNAANDNGRRRRGGGRYYGRKGPSTGSGKTDSRSEGRRRR
jgi:ATP-dependent RNA helicase DeaD